MKTMLKFAYAIVAFSIGVSVFNVDAFAQAKTKKKPAAAPKPSQNLASMVDQWGDDE